MSAALKPLELVINPVFAPDSSDSVAPVIDINTGLPVIEATPYRKCMTALQTFVTQHEVVVPDNDPARVLATMAGEIITANWLRKAPETFEDTRATAAMLILLFEHIPAERIIPAGRDLRRLRAKSGPKHVPGGYDTTYSFLTRIEGRSLITRHDPNSLGERLTDDQMARLISLRGVYRSQSPTPSASF